MQGAHRFSHRGLPLPGSDRFSPTWQERRGPNPHFKEKVFSEKVKNQKHDLVINKKYWRRRGGGSGPCLAGWRGDSGLPALPRGGGPPRAPKGNRWPAFSFQASPLPFQTAEAHNWLFHSEPRRRKEKRAYFSQASTAQ